MQYEVAHISLLGDREDNQDRLGIAESHAGVVLMLADGLGGKAGGALAAETFIKSVQISLQREIMPLDEPEDFLQQLIIKAHYAVIAAGEKQDPQIEPNSTAVLCLIQNNKAWWAHVGDSRCYLFRNGLPLYRTQDDSYVEHLYQKGEITLDKQEDHPMRNYITQCIGTKNNEPSVSVSKGVELNEGDTLLLCSDGFWQPLDDALIGAGLTKNELQQPIKNLAQQAYKNVTPNGDNISTIALKISSLRNNNPAHLDNAIQEIKDTFDYYKDEMKK